MEQSVQVLLIEDSPLFVVLSRKMLAEAKTVKFGIQCANTLADGISQLAAGGIDAVLLDLTLPDCNGLETFQKLHLAAKGVPIVIYTSVDDEDLSLSALNHGAADYLVKSEVNANWLAKSLLYAIQRKRASTPTKESAKPDASSTEAVTAARSPDSETRWLAKVGEKRLVTVAVLEQLKATLLSLLRRPECTEVGLDMAQVEYISNAAISMLLIVHKRAAAAGKRLVLNGLKPQVHEQFSSRRFDKLFELRRAP